MALAVHFEGNVSMLMWCVIPFEAKVGMRHGAKFDVYNCTHRRGCVQLYQGFVARYAGSQCDCESLPGAASVSDPNRAFPDDAVGSRCRGSIHTIV